MLREERFTKVDIIRYPVPGLLYQSALSMEDLWGGFQYSITGSCSRNTDITTGVGENSEKITIFLRQAKCGGVHSCTMCPFTLQSSKHKKSCSCGGELVKVGCNVKLYAFQLHDSSYFYSEGHHGHKDPPIHKSTKKEDGIIKQAVKINPTLTASDLGLDCVIIRKPRLTASILDRFEI